MRRTLGVGVMLCVLCGAGRALSQDAPAATSTGTVTGVLTGVVIDKSSGDPIIEAGIEVIGHPQKTRTDLDGKFRIELGPGQYEVRVFAPLYQGTRLQNVVVKPGEVTKLNASLLPEGKAGVEVVEVVAQASKAAEATQLIARKKSAVVTDNVAAETIAKSPDRNAAEVIKRVPAVTVQNNKYVFVRGLGERYSSALLNGSRLPSTDPSKRVVPLDLFPNEFVESLNIVKSYTPDLPGDFSGGLVDIRLREFPERLSYTMGTTVSVNTNATFHSFDTYDGASMDYFGFGGNFRELPPNIPDDLTDQKVPPAQQRAYASSFHNIWTPHSKSAPPNFSINASIGDTIGPVGMSLGAIYSTEYRRHPDEVQENFTGQRDENGNIELIPLPDNLTFDRSTFLARVGAVLSTGYKITPDHKLSLRALVDHNATDEVVNGIGHDRNLPPEKQIQQWRLQYTEEQLGYGQLAGADHWSWVDVDWHTALSQTTESQPDTRIITYALDPGEGVSRRLFPSGQGPESSERLFADLNEYLTDSAVDLTVPFKTALPFTDVWSGLAAKLKFGPAYAYRKRNFDYRRFLYNQVTPQQGVDFSQDPEIVLAPENVGPNFSFSENTQKTDSFDATQEIAAMYGMFDLPIIADRLRLVAGVREEYSYITTDSADMHQNPLHTVINDLSPLPGANLIFSPRDDMNVRYAYSRSVSRPEFRELTPTRFVVPNGERPVIGNSDLVTADIESHDLRWEWFLSPTEIVSLGGFYKILTKPIEQVVKGESAGEADSFRNADDGRLVGFEFEARKNLDIVSPYLRGFSLMTNVAYIDSEVNVGEQVGTEVQTNSKRALQGQAPFVVNAALEYAHPNWGTARLLYNTFGDRIVAAGANNLPDVFEHQRNVLDLVLLAPINPFGTPLTLKFAAENLLNEAVLQTQADKTTRRYTTGVRISFGVAYSY